MAKVNTVLGPMDTEDLGFTLMHEHLLCAFPDAYRDYPDILVPNALEYVVTRLKQAKAGGVDTVVDMTTLDLGRDIHRPGSCYTKRGPGRVAGRHKDKGFQPEPPHQTGGDI